MFSIEHVTSRYEHIYEEAALAGGKIKPRQRTFSFKALLTKYNSNNIKKLSVCWFAEPVTEERYIKVKRQH